MPARVCNFWLIANVDGRATPVTIGPAAADGGFTLVVLMREDGGVSEKRLRITGRAIRGGRLMLEANVEGTDQKEGLLIATDR